ncbi:hypothetical protein PsorP6_015971 [Peronosclerospora sorghi]|uniref:Uncharacterized protein n=1 Tax=Peronosclerospora sorghi TaxID=230839 RepID=A0ACC0WMQ8_9STRA|nr:hypothetical protein PsorP6_015971 [Peronosclerospora sorghi]
MAKTSPDRNTRRCCYELIAKAELDVKIDQIYDFELCLFDTQGANVGVLIWLMACTLFTLNADDEEFIRWQAPECLREHIAYRPSLRSSSEKDSVLASSSASPSATTFATDVYAFGMCILEA